MLVGSRDSGRKVVRENGAGLPADEYDLDAVGYKRLSPLFVQ